MTVVVYALYSFVFCFLQPRIHSFTVPSSFPRSSSAPGFSHLQYLIIFRGTAGVAMVRLNEVNGRYHLTWALFQRSICGWTSPGISNPCFCICRIHVHLPLQLFSRNAGGCHLQKFAWNSKYRLGKKGWLIEMDKRSSNHESWLMGFPKSCKRSINHEPCLTGFLGSEYVGKSDSQPAGKMGKANQ